MEGPPWNIEKISVLISRFFEKHWMNSEEISFTRKVMLTHERLINSVDGNYFKLQFAGSRSEGIAISGSDIDVMIVDNNVVVLYPGKIVPPDDAHKTLLYVRESDCRPGYVNLQLGHRGQRYESCLVNALVPVGNVIFVSSDMYREQVVNERTMKYGTHFATSGPSCSVDATDSVRCFHFESWPREADQWVTRPRLNGWPSQALIDNIVQSGCHLVPVGDKCSDDTILQWRISFASAERLLVHSFSQIQVKIYCFLKYFLKQMKDTLQASLGNEDDDILCSYHLKTLMFTSIENSNPKLWQEQLFFYCFWFCFNILISCVRAGHFPNYFIPTNNLFQRKVHGQNQQKLFYILSRFHSEKLLCLSHSCRQYPQYNLLRYVTDSGVQTELMRTETTQELECRRDMSTIRTLMIQMNTFQSHPPTIVRKLIESIGKSISEVDEVIIFATIVDVLYKEATMKVHQELIAGHKNNKTRYRTLTKCQHRLTLCASMGTHLLHLATLYFLTGNYLKARKMCGQIISQPLYYTDSNGHLPPKLEDTYIRQFCGKGYTLIHKLKNTFTSVFHQHQKSMHLPHLRPEIARRPLGVLIPPLPYAVFLSFLCCHELNDRSGCHVALRNLMQVKDIADQGGFDHWIVHTLLGICYQTLGDYPRAISAYRDSAQTKTEGHQYNPALERIAALQKFCR